MRIVWSLDISGFKTNKKGINKNINHYDLEDIDLEEIARLIIEGNRGGILDKEEESDL